jgi:hypothetical protein
MIMAISRHDHNWLLMTRRDPPPVGFPTTWCPEIGLTSLNPVPQVGQELFIQFPDGTVMSKELTGRVGDDVMTPDAQRLLNAPIVMIEDGRTLS